MQTHIPPPDGLTPELRRVGDAVTAAVTALSDLAACVSRAADRHGTRDVATHLGVTRSTVSRWRAADLPGLAQLERCRAELAQ